MPKPIQITIPTPCHEKWADMTPADKGRFCASCQKTVIDFTRASDREIAQALGNNKDLCGRFMPTQLERDLVVPKEKSSLWAAASAAVISFLTIGCGGTQVKNSVNTEQTDNKTDDIKVDNSQEDYKIIKGIVSDETGSLPGAHITNTTTGESVLSDLDGAYTIKAKVGHIIEYSFIGYKTFSVTVVKKSSTVNIKLKDDGIVLGQVITGYPWSTELRKNR